MNRPPRGKGEILALSPSFARVAPSVPPARLLRAYGRVLLAALALAAGLAPSDADAKGSPYLVVPDPAVAEASPAYRYANMTDEEAFAEVDRRHILYTR